MCCEFWMPTSKRPSAQTTYRCERYFKSSCEISGDRNTTTVFLDQHLVLYLAANFDGNPSPHRLTLSGGHQHLDDPKSEPPGRVWSWKFVCTTVPLRYSKRCNKRFQRDLETDFVDMKYQMCTCSILDAGWGARQFYCKIEYNAIQ